MDSPVIQTHLGLVSGLGLKWQKDNVRFIEGIYMSGAAEGH